MKKTYITPMMRCIVTSHTDMLCTSGSLNINDDNFATYDGTGGDDGTDSYSKKQTLWDFEW